MSQPSSAPQGYRLRLSVGIYATGFIVSQAQMTTISLATCDADFLRDHANDPLFALKWRIPDYNYELIPIKYGDLTGPHIFSVSFFP
jgi:hypothetical protein